jgi:hypothetical protein
MEQAADTTMVRSIGGASASLVGESTPAWKI